MNVMMAANSSGGQKKVAAPKVPFFNEEDFNAAVVKHKLYGEPNKKVRGQKFIHITETYNQGRAPSEQRDVSQVQNHFNKLKQKVNQMISHNR